MESSGIEGSPAHTCKTCRAALLTQQLGVLHCCTTTHLQILTAVNLYRDPDKYASTLSQLQDDTMFKYNNSIIVPHVSTKSPPPSLPLLCPGAPPFTLSCCVHTRCFGDTVVAGAPRVWSSDHIPNHLH